MEGADLAAQELPKPKKRAPSLGVPFEKDDPRINRKGREKGKANLNKELLDAIIDFKKGDRTYLQLLLERALKRDAVACKILDKVFANASPADQLTIFNSFEAVLQEARGGQGSMPVTAKSRLDAYLGDEEEGGN